MRHVGENTGKMGRIFGGGSTIPPAFTAHPDFDEEAESHVVLYSRLMHYLRGGVVGEGDSFAEHRHPCDLGRWLAHEGGVRHGQQSSFRRLHDLHEQFHREVEAALALLHAGSWKAAEQLCRRELSLSLRRLLSAITEMNEAMHGETAASVN